MQDELTQAGLDVAILGVNAAGLESGNANFCAGRDLPWLQETVAEPLWTDWAVTWRDVILLDANNQVITTYNLTQHNLADPANYAALYQLFATAAQP
ncbi:MAG: hypothetical protein U0271_37560 [Polyangiaceae bacterium]